MANSGTGLKQLCRPRLERGSIPAKEQVIKKTRRLDELRKRKIAEWIQRETWEELYNSKGLAKEFEQIVFKKLDEICPKECVKITKFY